MSNIKLSDIGRLDFNLAVTFLAIWQERSVSRAATRLSLSQSAVSAALARLRNATNDPLFIRTKGGMEPTARAISMAGQIHQGIELLRQAMVVEDTFDPATSTRHFSLGMSDDFEVALGPGIAARLLASAPAVSVVFRQANRHTVEQMLEARDIDLAIASGVPPRSWMVTDDLGRSGYASLFNNRLCQLPLPLSLDDFLGVPHILISFLGREGIVDSALKTIGRSRTIHTALTHFSSLPAYLGSMRVIASLPSHAARTLADNSGLDMSPVPLDLGTYIVSMHHRRDVADDPALRWLKGIIREAFEATVPQDEAAA
jgi:DNA-binding transcriptional LysR family regulator